MSVGVRLSNLKFQSTSYVIMNRVVINISGEKFETYEETLSRYPETLLGCAENRQPYYDSRFGEYYFNRSRLAFEAILFYYQSYGKIVRPENVTEKQFVKELTFFKIGQPEQWLTFTEKVDRMIIGDPMRLPENKIQRFFWKLFSVPESSRTAYVTHVWSFFVLVVSIVLACTASIPELKNKNKTDGLKPQRIINILDHFCYIWFTIEFVGRFLSASDKLKFFKSFLNIIDLVSVVPYYLQMIIESGTQMTPLAILRTLRMFRVARLMKFSRHSRGMRALIYTLYASRHELEHFFFITLVGTLFSASMAYYAEMSSEESSVKHIPIAMWWSINTVTTVGYGDIYPITPFGKFLGGGLSVLGTILLGLPVYCLVSNFTELWESIKEVTNDERDAALNKAKVKDDEEKCSDKLREYFGTGGCEHTPYSPEILPFIPAVSAGGSWS